MISGANSSDGADMSSDLILIETLPAPFDVWAVYSFWSRESVDAVEIQFHRVLFFGLYTSSDCAERCDAENPPTIYPFVPSLIEAGSYAPSFSKHLVEAANYKFIGICDAYGKDRMQWQHKAEAAFKESTEKSASENKGESLSAH